MIEQSQLDAAIKAQIEPLNLKLGESDSAVVLNKSGNLQTIMIVRTKVTFTQLNSH